MDEKRIFNNYKANCPVCGGDLDDNDTFCPYCGLDLKQHNQPHHNNEQVLKDAIDDIDTAKRQLAHREKQFTDNEKKKHNPLKILLSLMVGGFVLFLAFGFIAGILLSVSEASDEKKVEKLKNELYTQEVNTRTVDEIDIDDYEFTNTNKQSAAGYIQESDDLFLIPFYASTYDSDAVFKGQVAVQKEGFVEFSTVEVDRISIQYENYRLYLHFDNSPYYDRTIDTITILADYADEFIRRNDVKIDDDVFECYDEGPNDDLYFVANPYDQCYINVSVYPLRYEEDAFDRDNIFPILYIDHQLEIN